MLIFAVLFFATSCIALCINDVRPLPCSPSTKILNPGWGIFRPNSAAFLAAVCATQAWLLPLSTLAFLSNSSVESNLKSFNSILEHSCLALKICIIYSKFILFSVVFVGVIDASVTYSNVLLLHRPILLPQPSAHLGLWLLFSKMAHWFLSNPL